ncbi:MAG: hypothetical protein KAT68_16930 [Bacteroidales bacterium]|nr:hypothetical protein [Bacteroidales bacterium]
MKKAILKALNIKTDEASSVLFLIIQSVFLGVFYGAFDIGASALFLDVFSPDMLPQAFLVSGIIGIILTTIYSRLHSRISFRKLSIINLITMSVLTCLMRFGFELTLSKWHAFLVFIMMGPLNIIGLLGFWGTVSRMFTLRQGKRLFGMIDTGQVIGIIISSYTIPLLLTFSFKTMNLLLISAVSIIIALFFQLIITRKFKLKLSDKIKDTSSTVKSKFSDLFKNRYIFLMVLFVALSMITAFFIYNSFLAVIHDKYPEASDLAKFLGFFTGSLMIFSLLIKTFVYSNLMKTYGLKVSLILTPLLLIIITIIASITGSFGYSIEFQSFMIFFLLISLSRLFSVSLKTSIEGPAFKILYQSLDKSIRYDIQAKIDGIVNEFAALLAGIILTLLGLLKFFELIHFSYTLIILLAIWSYIAIYLYKAYRTSLEKSLETSKTKDVTHNKELGISDILKNKLETPEINILPQVLKITEIINPYLHEQYILKFISSKSEEVRKFAISHACKQNFISASKILSEQIITDKKLTEIINPFIDNFNSKINIQYSYEDISLLVKSKEINNRILAAQIIENNKDKKLVSFLVILLRDIEPLVKIAALKASGKIQNKETLPLLADYLSYPKYCNYATSALISAGEKSLDTLEQTFNKSDIKENVLYYIVKTYGLIGGNKAIKLLINKLDYHNREIVNQAILSLQLCNYTATSENIHKLIHGIEQTIEVIAWNITALASIKTDEVGEQLEEAFNEELEQNYNILFHLLSIAYDPQSILHVRENLENETSEGIGYAIELLDLFVAEELKPILFPIIDDISNIEKSKQLQNHFPVEIMNSRELINAIINRNPIYINRWTKACALISLEKLNNTEISNDIIAQLFNPDKLLREISGKFIYDKDINLYNNCVKRIDNKLEEDINKSINLLKIKNSHLLIEKIKYLNNIEEFNKLQGSILAEIADNIDDINMDNDETIKITDQSKPNIYFIVKGNLILKKNENDIKIFKEKEFFSEFYFKDLSIDNPMILQSKGQTNLYKINNDKLKELLFNNNEIVKTIINTFSDNYVI